MNDPILLVGLSNIGDAVLTTPVMLALHELFPDALLDIAADRRSAPVYEPCPFRRRVLLKDKDRPLRGLPRLLRELRGERYALVVDLRTDFLAYLVRARRRCAKWSARPYGAHAVQRHLGVIADLWGERPLPPVRVWPGAAERALAAASVPAGQRWLALAPGANWAPKIWPAGHFAALLAELRADFDGVLLLGDGRDAGLAAAVAAAAPLPCTNLCGQSTIMQAAALLERATAFVGNDSGLGHLAAAAGCATLTLFGPGEPARYHPWSARAAWLRAPGGTLDRLDAGTVAARLRALLAPAATD